MYVDLSNQDALLNTSHTILEAELLSDLLYNVPIVWHNIAEFTAPISNGIWGIPASPLQLDTQVAWGAPNAKAHIDTYISERQSVLRTLAAKNPLTRERATISLSAYADFATVKAFLERHALRAESVWYRATRHGFSGGFCVHGSLPASVERVIRGLEENMASTKAQLKTAPADERPILEKSLAKHKMMIEAFSSGSAKAYGLDVEAEVGRLYALQADPMTRLVDVRPSTTTRPESQGQGRPLQPGSEER